MNRKNAGLGFAAALLAFSLAGPASAARVYVNIAPPAFRAEARGPCPSPRHAWVDGFWRWDGRTHVWVAGRWALPPHPRAMWVPGHWRHAHAGWFWVSGRWRR